MKPRITISLTESGSLEILLNEAGRDQFVRELQKLNEKHEHFHFDPDGSGEIKVRSRAYGPDDRILAYGKVLFRTDDWDRQHFPHVIDPEDQD